MTDDANPNLNANLSVKPNPPAALHEVFFYLFGFQLKFLMLAIRIDMIYISCLDMISSSILLIYMIKFIIAIIIMLNLQLFWIKAYEKNGHNSSIMCSQTDTPTEF
jgi:hypothetical protein